MTIAPAIASFEVGDVRITRILEIDTLSIPPFGMVQASHDEILRYGWLQPHFATACGDINVHIQAFVVDTGAVRILVDPCCGNDKDRPNFPPGHKLQSGFLDHLVQAGYHPDDMDFVVCTHLHMDHVGWNTKLVAGEWIPTFTNARYVFGRIEHEHALAEPQEEGAIYADSIGPVVASGQADLVELGHSIAPGVTMVSTPGHTPGHCSIEIKSGGKIAIITGDVIHHPVQAASLEINSNFCEDHESARRTRMELLAMAADKGITLVGSHFADPFAVTVARDATAFRLAGHEDVDKGLIG